MRLLLDEHYSPEIAARLRERDHDVVATAQAGLGGSDDEALLIAAAATDRALLTNNARHFVPLARRWAAEGRAHAGLLLTADASMPRSEQSIGLYVAVLDGLLRKRPGDAALRDQVRWLKPPDGRTAS